METEFEGTNLPKKQNSSKTDKQIQNTKSSCDQNQLKNSTEHKPKTNVSQSNVLHTHTFSN